MLGKISDQGQPQPLWDLTAVPAEWPLQTVLDAWAAVAGARSNDAAVHRGLRAAEKAVESRLEELWASQPQDAQRWFAQHLELYFQQNLDGWTEEEQLRQVLLEHWDRISHDARSHFSAVGLVAKAWPLGVGWRCPSAPRLLAARGPVEAEAEAEAKRRRLEEASSIKELQAKTEERLRTELVEAREQREALAAQLAEAEAAKAVELRALQEECGRLTDGLAVAASELQAARDELGTCRKECQHLQHRAEAEAADGQRKLRQAQEESCEHRDRCEQLQKRLAASEAASGRGPDLQALLVENAVYKDLCKQLSEQINQQTDRTIGQIQSLSEEKGMYKERCRHLQRKLAEAQLEARRLGGGISLQPTFAQHGQGASSSEESNSNIEADYILVDDDTLSELSYSSWFSVQPHCFMLDAIFKTRKYDTDFFLMGKDLVKGSQLVAGDDKTIVEVAEAPKICKATEVVHLQAGAATLRVTPDHLVQVHDAQGELSGSPYVPAGKLKEGDLVALDSGEPEALTSVNKFSLDCDVLKIVFEPDLPVAVFSCPPCILSKGHKKKVPPRRGGMCHRFQETVDHSADGGVSIPRTAGDYMD